VHDEQDPEKQKVLMTKFASEMLIPHMAVLEAQLAKNGGVLVGKGVTWADIACYAFFNHATVKHPDILKDSPNMAALVSQIGSNDNIKKYLETRPAYQ
jgi:glutathione S-transferase